MKTASNLLIMSWMIVNLHYMNHFKQLAPVRYFKKDNWVYFTC